ncbi:hypothetical protein D4768_22095 [Rhodococcus erythropolis]|uniref:hypothetical protein n=1 Tax=Rhodococcus erythropolis TaxID=1833 RepID=UPI001F1C2FAD|nr:hypothetical protein [Rhodococcus erythropolis]UJC80072.1 hypothetical protein D4768_22095 [Rhodococcus erythropolis]
MEDENITDENTTEPTTTEPPNDADNVQSTEHDEQVQLLQSQVLALQTTAVAAAIGQLGYQPRAVLTHTPITELLDANGNPDPALIAAATEAAAAEFGLAQVPRRPAPVPTLGSGKGDKPANTPTWGQILRG